MEDTSGRVHRLADTTYRNNVELWTELHRLTNAAKAYHKAMQGLAQASDHFHSILNSIGNKAANLPGSVRKLGDATEDLVAGYRQIEKQYAGLMHSLNTDFIVPLETKLEAEEKSLTGMQKMYKQENGKKELLVSKTSDQVRSMKKKKHLSTVQQEKIAQLTQILRDQEDELHLARVEGLRKALLEERKLHCFVLDHLCSVIHNQIAYNAMSHEALSTRVNNLRSLASSPSQLPEESAALLVDPRSPRAYPQSRSEDGLPSGSPKPRNRRISCRVKALYPHQTQETSQLEFTPGDLIDALDAPQDGWQYGENTRTGSTGWFPVHFVNQVWPTPPTQHKSQSVAAPSPVASPPDQPTSPALPDKDY
jgi:hypothetical protein